MAEQQGTRSEESATQGEGTQSIRAPTRHLDDVLSLIGALHENHGTECSTEALATTIGTTSKSGSYRLLVASARTFGLLKDTRGVAALTDLGHAALDPALRESALADAFLAVPLYRLIYEKFDGRILPPDPGLEKELRELGISPGSASRARRILRQSASTAGFFGEGNNRLVRPSRTPRDAPEGDMGAATRDTAPQLVEASGCDHPVLKALWATLPNEKFAEGQQRQWFEIFEKAFEMVYGPMNDGE